MADWTNMRQVYIKWLDQKFEKLIKHKYVQPFPLTLINI